VIEGVSLTDGAFSEGGGYLADASGGIAVLISDGTFPRGVLVRVAGTVDDRFHQRTVRTTAAELVAGDAAPEPEAVSVPTGTVGEELEGRLVTVAGTISGAPTSLSGGLAYELDDGSGIIRVLVGDVTSIDTGPWLTGASLTVRGVLGQRDSSGTGTAGYRVQPRDAEDVLGLSPPGATATPSPSGQPSDTPGPSGSPAPGVSSIADARRAASGTRLKVRGTVTLPSGLVERGSAAIQDASGAILLRLGDEAGALSLGTLVEAEGVRSTKSGMATLRVTVAPRRLGSQAPPAPARRASGALGEADEATLVIVRGALAGKPTRTSAENVYVDLDDGSGPIRVFASPRSGIDLQDVPAGAWVEVTGVLGQETSGQQPLRGYRIWPRVVADLSVLAEPVAGAGGPAGSAGSGGSGGPGISSAGGAGQGTSSAHASPPSLPVPLLALALPTSASAPPLTGRPMGEVAPARQPPMAAGLLAAAGLLWLAAGGMLGGREGLQHLVAALMSRLRAARSDEEASGAGASPPGADAPPAGPLDPPALVPLTVLGGAAGARSALSTRRERDRAREVERILPPT
jgi:hypothetical protein